MAVSRVLPAGDCNLLSSTSPQGRRLRVVPEAPTFAEPLPGLELIGWYAVVAPGRTLARIVGRLKTPSTMPCIRQT